LKDGDEVVGNRVRVRVVKNKVAPPFKEAEFDIMFGKGINYEGELIDIGQKYNIIQRAGTWFSYGDDRMGQGRENARSFLVNNPDLRDKLKTEIFEKAGLSSNGHSKEEKPAEEEPEKATAKK
jgi:recombination protein RecA